ncbi:transposase [bacterium]|nr:transposase [bacterium]
MHDHKGQLCPKCQNKVQFTKVNGRGTYYCPNCQK